MVTPAKTFLLLAGAVLLVVPTWLMVMWIVIFRRGNLDHAAKVAEFLSLVPQAVRDPLSLTFVALGCSVVGILSGTVCVVRAKGIRKTVAIVEIVLGMALVFPLLFSLL